MTRQEKKLTVTINRCKHYVRNAINDYYKTNVIFDKLDDAKLKINH